MATYRVEVGRRYTGFEYVSIEVEADNPKQASELAVAKAAAGEFIELSGDEFLDADDWAVSKDYFTQEPTITEIIEV